LQISELISTAAQAALEIPIDSKSLILIEQQTI